MSNDKAGGSLVNPLPIVMVVLLTAGVLVKNVPLESARPGDSERVKFFSADKQDVEARLWQDPLGAVEKHENDLQSTRVREIHTLEMVRESIQQKLDEREGLSEVTVVAVSVSGSSYPEAAESRRRSRFAVISALGFHHYSPKNPDALGYFRFPLPEREPQSRTVDADKQLKAPFLNVPFEWFKRGELSSNMPSSNVLVLWLNEDKLTNGLDQMYDLFDDLAPSTPSRISFKLIGPAGSGMLVDLTRRGQEQHPRRLKSGKTLEKFSPSATISNCDLGPESVSPNGELRPPWHCFLYFSSIYAKILEDHSIVRTIGTDDVLATALLWELWQRGVNRELVYKDLSQIQGETSLVKPPNPADPQPKCKDGLVLVSEWDSEYARTLSRYLSDGFSERCGAKSSHVRTFTYLRGLDGVLPDIDKPGSNALRKGDGDKSKDLRAQLDDTPPEHAEGRSQSDYLRRLADEIARLDGDKEFTKRGVKAIGIVGSDVYDKLLILQALRGRFKDKIFFTTDLDARYLHADQKAWTRNLVVASNFGLSLRPALQQSTMPFRDSYQIAIYVAGLMAFDSGSFKLIRTDKIGFSADIISKWLRPQIFEIDRTESVYSALPPIRDLRYAEKVFFTTAHDNTFLHDDEKTWTRHLMDASNFGLLLRPAQQQSTTMPYFTGLMALYDEPFNVKVWTDNMSKWLRPQIFEIGRTEAVHLASPSISDLRKWLDGIDPKGTLGKKDNITCDGNWNKWRECNDIEPARPEQDFSHKPAAIFMVLPATIFMVFLGIVLIALMNRHVHETLRALTSPVPAKARYARFAMIGVAGLVFAVLSFLAVVKSELDTALENGVGEPFVWLEGVSVWPSLVLRFISFVLMLVLVLVFIVGIRRQTQLIAERFGFTPPQTGTLARSRWSALWIGPYLDLALFDAEGKPSPKPGGAALEIVTVWHNYLRASNWREMAGWATVSTLLVFLLAFAAFYIFGVPSFPHRGQLVEKLYYVLVTLNMSFLWFVIFSVNYQTRVCAQFIETLSNVRNVWPKPLLDREAIETNVPRAYLDDYLDFQLIVLATRRIHGLIYLPFVSILFMVIAHSNIFDAVNFPLIPVLLAGFALVYALYTAALLRKTAEGVRTKALANYEALLLIQARLKETPPAAIDDTAADPTRPPISTEQIKLLMERIRSTREGAFAPFTQQPALQALLLPFGGYGSIQLIEYLFKF